MVELKPCPFCGGEAKLEHNYMTDYGDSYWVSCCSCNVSTDSDWAQESVIATWNKRTE